GGLVSLIGDRLAPDNAFADQSPLPTSLAGVTVIVNGISARLFDATPGQIDLQLPWSLRAATATIRVFRNGVGSNALTLPVAQVAPGIFREHAYAGSQAQAFSFDSGLNPKGWVGPGNPLQPGDNVLVLMSGVGPLTDTPPDGAQGLADSNVALPVSAKL